MALLSSSRLYITIPLLYFTVLLSKHNTTIALLHSTWLLRKPTMALLHTTRLCITLPWLYFILLIDYIYNSTMALYVTLLDST